MRRFALVVICFAACSSCHGTAKMPANPPSTQQLVQELKARREHVRTLKADAKVEFWDNQEGERIKGRVSMWVTRTGQLRLDVTSQIGLLSALAVNGSTFQLLDVRGDKYFTGEASPCNVERVIHVRLPPREIADALLGDAPLPPGDVQPTLSWNGEKSRWVMTFDLGAAGKEILELSEKGHDIELAERFDASGKKLWWLEHEDFGPVKGGVTMPERSRFQQGDKADQDVILHMKEQSVNETPPEQAWVLETPPGIVQEEMRCDAR